MEELAMTIIALFMIYKLNIGISWWVCLLLFFTPDISMLGYLVNNQIGAISYNLFHSKAIAIAIIIIGVVMGNNYLIFAGLILFGHSSFDRIMGYGLKHFTGFNHTHLGIIGNKHT